MKMNKPPLWATIFTLCGIAVLIGLGSWQVKRLEWKNNLMASIEAAKAQDAMSFEITSNNLDEAAIKAPIKRAFAEGIYLDEKSILIGPRTHKGESGYHIITPFETLDNTVFLVNRGWIPVRDNVAAYPAPLQAEIITGTLIKRDKESRFLPENDPQKSQWHRLDFDQIAQSKGLGTLAPYLFYLDPQDSLNAPVAVTESFSLTNNHKSYALFWFTMAGVLAIIFALRFLRRSASQK